MSVCGEELPANGIEVGGSGERGKDVGGGGGGDGGGGKEVREDWRNDDGRFDKEQWGGAQGRNGSADCGKDSAKTALDGQRTRWRMVKEKGLRGKGFERRSELGRIGERGRVGRGKGRGRRK